MKIMTKDPSKYTVNEMICIYHEENKFHFCIIGIIISCLMEPEEVDSEKLKKLQKLWKVFGRETKAGKEMFDLYNIAEKPKLDYPKPKPKSQK